MSLAKLKKHPRYWLGKKRPPFSEEWRKSVSERMKGQKFRLGKKLTEETKKKIGDAQRGEKNHAYGKASPRRGVKCETLSKEKNPNWKGGTTSVARIIRSSTQYKLWRTAIFERDEYTCIWCGVKGGQLNADHIKPFALYPELRFAIDNGRTLCVPCHKTTDTYAGKTR